MWPLAKRLFRPEARSLLLLYVLFYVFRFALSLLDVPRVRLIERAICQQYYREHPVGNNVPVDLQSIPEKLCKLVAIQVEVATITAESMFSSGVRLIAETGIITAAYYGAVADRLGRRTALLLICLGEFLALVCTVVICSLDKLLPVRLVWGSALFLLIGGGDRMFASILLTMITDMTDHSRRTRLFFFIGMTDSLSEITAPPLVVWIMSVNLWLPFAISMILYAVMAILIWVVPETKDRKMIPTLESTDSDTLQPLVTPSSDTAECDSLLEQSTPAYGTHPWKETLKLMTDLNLFIMFFCFFVKRIGFTSESFFPQYASERFHLILRKTPWFNWAQAFGSTLMLGFVLPGFTIYLQRRQVSPQHSDMIIICSSLLILTTGFFAAWQATSPILFGLTIFFCGLGEGSAPGLQSLASSFVTPAQYARLFATIALVDTAGRFVSGPLMAKLHSIGRNDDNEPTGTLYLVSSVIFGVSLLSLWFLRWR